MLIRLIRHLNMPVLKSLNLIKPFKFATKKSH